MRGLRSHALNWGDQLSRLNGDTSGIALTEFAILLPIMLLMYLAGYQLSDAIACNRRVTIATRAAADLTSQVKCLNAGDMGSILSASGLSLTPYNAANAMIRVSEIDTNAAGNTTVGWSQAVNGIALMAGSTFVLPGSLKTNGTSLILSQVVYAYKPALTYGIVGNLNLSDAIYMSPRKSNTIVSTGCTST